jgi:hypothetical protein
MPEHQRFVRSPVSGLIGGGMTLVFPVAGSQTALSELFGALPMPPG